jgi:tripartite-type tricarboxylate transporter receptor subunit TctC
MLLTRSLLAGLAIAGLAILPAAAQKVSFAGKEIKMIVGFGAGSGYDQYARLIAAHIGRHLPGNPTVVPENMPGAGSIKAETYLYNQAPKDGTVIGAVARDSLTQPLINPGQGYHFDATKFGWLGSPDTETNICIFNAAAGAKSAADLFKKPTTLGSTGIGTGTHIYPVVMNGMLGTKFKVIDGYQASGDVTLAMERHEVDGICESYSSIMRKSAKDIHDGKLVILLQMGHAPNPELGGVKYVLDLAKTDDQRQALQLVYAGQSYARPLITPPGVPPATLKVLREAYEATLRDPKLLADAKKQKLEINPVSGEECAKILAKAYATPKPIVEKLVQIMSAKTATKTN